MLHSGVRLALPDILNLRSRECICTRQADDGIAEQHHSIENLLIVGTIDATRCERLESRWGICPHQNKHQRLKFFKHGYGCFVFVIYILMSRASIIYSISGGTTDTDALGERFALFDLSSVV